MEYSLDLCGDSLLLARFMAGSLRTSNDDHFLDVACASHVMIATQFGCKKFHHIIAMSFRVLLIRRTSVENKLGKTLFSSNIVLNTNMFRTNAYASLVRRAFFAVEKKLNVFLFS